MFFRAVAWRLSFASRRVGQIIMLRTKVGGNVDKREWKYVILEVVKGGGHTHLVVGQKSLSCGAPPSAAVFVL